MQSLEDWEFLLQAHQKAEFKAVDLIAAVIYKDFVNFGNRRGSTPEAMGSEVCSEYLYVYKRVAPTTPELRAARKVLFHPISNSG